MKEQTKKLKAKNIQKEEEISDEKENIYEVEKIINCKINIKTNTRLFLIKWKNCSSKENTWEPEENLHPELLKKYTKKMDLHRKIKRIVEVIKIRNKKKVTVEMRDSTLKTYDYETAVVFFPIRLIRFYLLLTSNLSGSK